MIFLEGNFQEKTPKGGEGGGWDPLIHPQSYMANTSPPPLPCKSWEADMGGYRSHCWKGFFWKVILGLQSRRFDWEISGGCKPPKY